MKSKYTPEDLARFLEKEAAKASSTKVEPTAAPVGQALA
jgi:hypothetical protein